jgi:hypothetical protein
MATPIHSQSFRDMAQRQNNAANSFYDSLAEQFHFSKEDAEKILAVYIYRKVIKLDPITGQFNLKHGAYWDKEVMSRALAQFPTIFPAGVILV